ncbi:MAG: VIT domain-containing protein, partial [Planctomycetota bacterium]
MSGTRGSRSVCAVVAAVFLFLIAPTAGAAGMLIPRNGGSPIKVREHEVSVEIADGLAKTTLRQTFVNPHGRALEAIYVFPLPEDAALVDVAMEVGGQRLEGLLVERSRARAIYDQIVSSRRDPALVEKIGRNRFRLSVFPVLPRVRTIVELTWIEQVPL